MRAAEDFWIGVLLSLSVAVCASGQEPAMGPRVGISDETILVRDGSPNCVIVYPSGSSEYAPLAVKIQEAIASACRAKPDIYKDTDILASEFFVSDDFKRKNLILLGDLNTNRAFVQLAANFYVYSTCEWPGENGYELRTVANPYGTKSNCVILGGSNVSGVGLAVDEFVSIIENPLYPPYQGDLGELLVLPRLLKVVVNGEDQSQLGAASPKWGDKFNDTYRFAYIAESYNRTGSPARLQVVRQTLDEHFRAGSSPTANDYGTESAVRALDLVDTFVMTPEENQEMDNKLLQWVLRVVNDPPYWNPLGRRWSFGGHQACGSLSFYVVVNYLLKNGNPNEAAQKLLEQKLKESREFLNYLSTSFKDEQNDVGWETWTPLQVPVRYALAEGDMTFFESGAAVNVVKRCFYAGQGFSPAAFVSFVFNDGEFKSVEPKGNLAGWAFVMTTDWPAPPDVEAKPPNFLIGAKVMPSNHPDWEHAYRKPEEGRARWYTHLPWEKTFHLAGFAGGVGEEDQFAVLGGWDSTRAPNEANSLRVFRQGGHEFLMRVNGEDQRQPRPGRFYQNSIVINAGEYMDPPPCAAELLAHHGGSQISMVSSRLSDYSGVDWDRNVFWHRDKYFAILDICSIKEAGKLAISNQWWNKDNPLLDGDTWMAHTDVGAFRLIMSGVGDAVSKQQWPDGPHQLRQTKVIDANPGQVVSFCNAFYVDNDELRQSYEIRKADQTAMMIKGMEELALMGCCTDGKPLSLGSITVESPLFFISPDDLALSSGGRLTVDGQKIEAGDADILRKALDALWETLPAQSAESAAKPDEISDSGVRLSAVTERASVAQTDYAAISGVSFTKDDDGTVTWDMGRDVKVTRIDGIRCEGDNLTVTCSSDNFRSDIRTVQAKKVVRHRWVHYQYGFAADLGLGTLGPIDQTARYFRIGSPDDKLSYGFWIDKEWHNQSWNVTGHNPELFNRPFWQDVVFRSDVPRVEFTRIMAVDIDGDGSDEIVASTDGFELLILNPDGTLRWKRDFAGPILNFICEDMESDGYREIIVVCHDNFVYCFEHDGDLRFKLDMLDSEGGANTRTGTSASVYDDSEGKRGLAVFTYHGCLKYDHDGNFVKGINGPGFYNDTALPVAVDFNGDGIPDFAIRENLWGSFNFVDGGSFEPVASTGTNHTGKGLAMLPWSMGGGQETNAVLVIARSGVDMIRPGTGVGKPTGGDAAVVRGGISTIFSLPISPITGWDIADLNGDGKDEIVLSTFYGSVIVLNEMGKVVSSDLAGTEVFDVGVIADEEGKPYILVSTGSELLLYDTEIRLLHRQIVEGAPCTKIQRFAEGGRRQAMCFFEDGTVSVFRCDR